MADYKFSANFAHTSVCLLFFMERFEPSDGNRRERERCERCRWQSKRTKASDVLRRIATEPRRGRESTIKRQWSKTGSLTPRNKRHTSLCILSE